MLQTMYVSAAAAPFSPDHLIDLLQKARTKNTALGISGLLLFHEGSFIQILEGPAAPVRNLVETIARDPRHRKVQVLVNREIVQRAFDGWDMGFVNTSEHEFGSVPGYLDYLTDLTVTGARWETDRLLWSLDRFQQGGLRPFMGYKNSSVTAGKT